MNEHVVHALDYAVTVNPDVLTVAVGPVPVDPDAARTTEPGLLDRDHAGWRRRDISGGDRLGLLHDDHGLAVDLSSCALLGFDHHVCGWLRGRLPLVRRCLVPAGVTVVGYVELIRRRRTLIPGRALVVGCCRHGETSASCH